MLNSGIIPKPFTHVRWLLFYATNHGNFLIFPCQGLLQWKIWCDFLKSLHAGIFWMLFMWLYFFHFFFKIMNLWIPSNSKFGFRSGLTFCGISAEYSLLSKYSSCFLLPRLIKTSPPPPKKKHNNSKPKTNHTIRQFVVKENSLMVKMEPQGFVYFSHMCKLTIETMKKKSISNTY